MFEIKTTPQERMKSICRVIWYKRRACAISDKDYKAGFRAIRLIAEHNEIAIDAMEMAHVCGECDKLADTIERQIAELRDFKEREKI